MFEVKRVIGRNGDGSTKYAGFVGVRDTRDEAIAFAVELATKQAQTIDVFKTTGGSVPTISVARVHPDGGIDFS